MISDADSSLGLFEDAHRHHVTAFNSVPASNWPATDEQLAAGVETTLDTSSRNLLMSFNCDKLDPLGAFIDCKQED